MAHLGTPNARARLRLVTGSPGPRRTGGRFPRALRSLATASAACWIGAVARLGAGLALIPRLWRWASLGRRRQQPPPRDAQVIPFQPHRRAVPR